MKTILAQQLLKIITGVYKSAEELRCIEILNIIDFDIDEAETVPEFMQILKHCYSLAKTRGYEEIEKEIRWELDDIFIRMILIEKL